MKHIKKFEKFINEESKDLLYKITHPFQDYSISGLGNDVLVSKKIKKDHDEKFKSEPAPTGTNATDCVGTLDYIKVPVSDKISSEILSKLESGNYNIESAERHRDLGFLFKLKELPNLWNVKRGPTDCDVIYYLGKDGKYIESSNGCGDGSPKLIGLFSFLSSLPNLKK